MKNKTWIISGLVVILLVLVVSLGGFKFTVVDFRNAYDPNAIVEETDSYRCMEYWTEETVASVQGINSIPPEHTLKSVQISVDGYERTSDFTTCYAKVELKAQDPVDVTDYDKNTISACVGFLDTYGVKLLVDVPNFCDTNMCFTRSDYQFKYICDTTLNSISECENNMLQSDFYAENKDDIISYNVYYRGKTQAPNCPVVYFKSKDFYTLTYEGLVTYDDQYNNYVCRIDIEDVPYKCYDDVCYGRDMIAKEGRACVSYASEDVEQIYNVVFEGLVIEPPEVIENVTEDDIPSVDDPVIDEPVIDEPVPLTFFQKILNLKNKSNFDIVWKISAIVLVFVALMSLILLSGKKK